MPIFSTKFRYCSATYYVPHVFGDDKNVTFVDRLKRNGSLRAEKRLLEDTYHAIAGDSSTELMQEVENFLAATNMG